MQKVSNGQKKLAKNQKKRRQRKANKTGVPTTAGRQQRKKELVATDVRAQPPSPLDVWVNNQIDAVPVVVETPSTNYSYIAAGIVTRALEKGWLQSTSLAADPYYAWAYITELLQNYAGGKTPPAVSLPYALLSLCRALTGKTVPFNGKVGSIKYQNLISNVVLAPSSASLPMGPAPYQNTWNVWIPSPNPTVNGFPVAAAPPGYQDAQGQAAFQSLTQFLMKSDQQDFRTVANSVETSLDRDVSAFAVTSSTVGGGATGNGNGGFGTITYSEVPLFRPFLSLAGTRDSNAQVAPTTARYYRFETTTAGDPVFLGAMMGFVIDEPFWTFKRPPKLHCVDFMEFAEVTALWIQNMIQAYISYYQGINSQSNGLIIADITCPLTLQEVMLLLRGVLMQAFVGTQAAVQGLFPQTVTNNTQLDFEPYISSATTYAAGPVKIQLPIPILENISSLTQCLLKHHGKADPEWFIPVLGQYHGINLKSSDYTFTYLDQNQVEVVAPVFQQGAIYKRSTWDDKKKAYNTEVLAEAAISMTDGLSGSDYVFINSPTRLEELANKFNTWLSSKMSSFTVKTGTYGTEKGVNILKSVAMTRHFFRQQVTTEKKRIFIEDNRPRFYRTSVDASPYVSLVAVADTSYNKILSQPYEKIQSIWILPTNLIDAQASDSTLVPRWQLLEGESFRVTVATGNNGQSMSQKHGTYAAKLTKSFDAEKNDWMEFFDQASDTGNGGLLSGLVNSFVTAAFPGVAPISTAIANMIPI